jgi:hypothetical protein
MTPESLSAARATVSARLGGHVTLEAHANGEIVACFDGYSVGLGTFSAGAADRAQDLRKGLPLARNIDKEIDLLVRRLARHGLLKYHLRRSRNGEDLVADSRLLAVNAAARQCRCSCPVAVRIHATAR